MSKSILRSAGVGDRQAGPTRSVLGGPVRAIDSVTIRTSPFIHTEDDRCHSGGGTLCTKKVQVAHNAIAEPRVPELIPVIYSQPAGDVSHKPGGRLPLLSAMPEVTLATLKRTATNFAAW